VENRRNPLNMTTDDMIRELYKWAFGNGRPGVEHRLSLLEEERRGTATTKDIGHLEAKMGCDMDQIEAKLEARMDVIDAKIDLKFRDLTRQINTHEILKLLLLIATIVAAARGYFGG
jgi:hypothetical protein